MELPKELEQAMQDNKITVDEVINWANGIPKYKIFTKSDSGLASLIELYLGLKKEVKIEYESYVFRGDRTKIEDLVEGIYSWIQVLVSSIAAHRKFKGCPVEGCWKGVKQVGSEYFCKEHDRVTNPVENHSVTYWGSDETERTLIYCPPWVANEIGLLGGTWKLTGKLNDQKEFVVGKWAEIEPDEKFEAVEHIPEKIEELKPERPAPKIPESRTIDNGQVHEADLRNFEMLVNHFASGEEGLPLTKVFGVMTKYNMQTPIGDLIKAVEDVEIVHAEKGISISFTDVKPDKMDDYIIRKKRD